MIANLIFIVTSVLLNALAQILLKYMGKPILTEEQIEVA